MAGTIQTITDKSAFESIFYQNFSGGDMFLKTSNGNLKIAFLGYTDGQIAFRIPYIKSMPETALVFARKDETTVYVELRTIEKQEADVFIFAPIKVQIIFASRRENRTAVAGTGEGKNLLFVSHIASDFNLFDSVSLEKKKTVFIKDKVLSDLTRIFPSVSVHFCAEESGDARMRFFNENGNKPIFIPDITKGPQEGDKNDFAFYKEFIYAKEQFNMKRKNLISEASVPILYRGMIPFGYITVTNTVTLDASCIQILKRAAVLSEQMMIRGGVIRDVCDERLLVSDISRGGIGIVFRDRRFVRYFKEKKTASFDLILSNGSIVPIAATVKNIALLESKIIKVGCAIIHVDENGKAAYEAYLATHLPPAPPAEQPPAAPAPEAAAEKPEPMVK